MLRQLRERRCSRNSRGLSTRGATGRRLLHFTHIDCMTSQNTEAKSRPKRSIFGWLRRDPDARREAALEKAARKAEKRLRKEEKANRNKADEARLNTVREEAEKAREALRAQEEARRGKQRVLQRDLSGEAEPESDEGMLGAFRRGSPRHARRCPVG